MLGLSVLLAFDAHADILLDGHQHIGDFDGAPFTPADFVTTSQHRSNPTRFHLSQTATITAVRLNNPLSLGQNIGVRIDGVNRSGTTDLATGIITLTSSPPLTLGAGPHSLALNPGCENSSGLPASCPSSSENDIGFSSITLISSAITTSRNLNQRRHIGSNAGENNQYRGNFYPDVPDARNLDIIFNLDRNRRLNEIRFHRLRDVRNNPVSFARVRIDGTSVGNLTRNGDPFVLTTGALLLAGDHTLRVEVGTSSGTTDDDISWDDILLLLSDDPAITPGRFNAVDPGRDGVTGPITTRVAGTAFSLDIIALDSTGLAILPSYSGTVTVDLLNATNDTGAADAFGCRGTWTLSQTLGSIAFTTADNGRKTLAGIVQSDVLRIGRVRVTDSTLAVGGCSRDAFAIRPASFGLEVSDQDAISPGTARNLQAASYDENSTPTHRAGQLYTIRATATNSAGAITPGYVGAPTVLAASALPGVGANLGEARADIWYPVAGQNGVVRSDRAKYSEAGAFILRVSDTTFAAVDSADTAPALLQIGPNEINVGRFTPDNFEVSLTIPGEFRPGCIAFTYAGQPVNYAIAPRATVTAINADGTPTLNYTGNLFKLPGNLAQSTYEARDPVTGLASSAILDLGALLIPDNTVTETGNGQAIILLDVGATGMTLRRNAPLAPFNADIAVTLAAISDSEGITYVGPPRTFGGTATGTGVPFTGGAKEIRFGRLVMDNAYGSERLPLDVPLRTEYWVGSGGSSGFAQNALDNCTSLPQANAVLTGAFVASNNISVSAMVPTTLAGGRGAIRLTAPSPSQGGQVTVTANLPAFSWLWVDGDGNNNYNELASANPSAQASFGVFKGDTRRIYQREMVR